MYAIRSKRTHRWFSGINTKTGVNSSHHLLMDEIPMLFQSEDLARVELLLHHMSVSAYDIVKVQLQIEEPLAQPKEIYSS